MRDIRGYMADSDEAQMSEINHRCGASTTLDLTKYAEFGELNDRVLAIAKKITNCRPTCLEVRPLFLRSIETSKIGSEEAGFGTSVNSLEQAMKFNGATFQGRGISQKIAFDPELTRAMAAAFDKVCDTFGLQKDTTDAQTNSTIANKIVDFAEQGERDPDQLCAKTVQALMREQNS